MPSEKEIYSSLRYRILLAKAKELNDSTEPRPNKPSDRIIRHCQSVRRILLEVSDPDWQPLDLQLIIVFGPFLAIVSA